MMIIHQHRPTKIPPKSILLLAVFLSCLEWTMGPSDGSHSNGYPGWLGGLGGLGTLLNVGMATIYFSYIFYMLGSTSFSNDKFIEGCIARGLVHNVNFASGARDRTAGSSTLSCSPHDSHSIGYSRNYRHSLGYHSRSNSLAESEVVSKSNVFNLKQMDDGSDQSHDQFDQRQQESSLKQLVVSILRGGHYEVVASHYENSAEQQQHPQYHQQHAQKDQPQQQNYRPPPPPPVQQFSQGFESGNTGTSGTLDQHRDHSNHQIYSQGSHEINAPPQPVFNGNRNHEEQASQFASTNAPYSHHQTRNSNNVPPQHSATTFGHQQNNYPIQNPQSSQMKVQNTHQNHHHTNHNHHQNPQSNIQTNTHTHQQTHQNTFQNPHQTSFQTIIQSFPPGTWQRYLRATKNDPIEAQKRLTSTHQWRQMHHMDQILLQPQSHFNLIKRYYPHAFHLRGYNNEPVYYESPPKIDLEELKKHGITLEELIRHYALITEFMWTHISPHQEGPTSKGITVIDLHGMKLRDFAGDVVSFVKRAAMFTSQHYPERSGCIFILNAPSFFRVVWRVVKPLVDPVTLTKVRIVDGSGSDLSVVRNALLERIPLENIPREYGGMSAVPMGCAPEERMLYELMERNNSRGRLGGGSVNSHDVHRGPQIHHGHSGSHVQSRHQESNAQSRYHHGHRGHHSSHLSTTQQHHHHQHQPHHHHHPKHQHENGYGSQCGAPQNDNVQMHR